MACEYFWCLIYLLILIFLELFMTKPVLALGWNKYLVDLGVSSNPSTFHSHFRKKIDMALFIWRDLISHYVYVECAHFNFISYLYYLIYI